MNNFLDNFFKDTDEESKGSSNNVNPFAKDNILNELPKNSPIKKVLIPIREISYLEESGFGAYVCEDTVVSKGEIFPDEMNISGEFVAPLILGQTYHVEGTIREYRGENQIKVQKIWNVRPVGKRGTIAYLQTLKGLKKKAELIYEEFGDESIKMLIESPMIVASRVSGIGKKSVLTWKEQLDQLAESQQTISTLLGWGLSMKQGKKLYDKYKDDIITKIEVNPYFLAQEVKGYGFETCDRIAKEIGVSPKSPFRLQEGLLHVLKQSISSGHCYLPLEELLKNARSILTIKLTYQEMKRFAREYSGKKSFEYSWGNPEKFLTENLLQEDGLTNIFQIDYDRMVECLYDYEHERSNAKKDSHRYVVCRVDVEDLSPEIQAIATQRRVIYEEDIIEADTVEVDNGQKSEDKKPKKNTRIYLKQMYYDEVKVAERVVCLSEKEPIFTREEVESVLDEVLKEKNIVLEEKQRIACIEFNLNKGGFSLLLGNAGTGKTFVLLIILEVKKRLYKRKFKKDLNTGIMVFAPTGKASRVASKATGMECVTVHRGLGYNPGSGFAYNSSEPLPCDVLVVDESSMLDISLTKSLLEAIASGTQIIFMGDTKQLPSVGAGNVLKDLVESGIVDVVMLDVVKRQGLLSGIIRTANSIIAGKMIETCNDTKDSYVLKRETVSGCHKAIIESIRRILTFDGYSHEEIQVLAPQRKGSAGTYMLNYILQQEFNPGNEDVKVLWDKFESVPNEKCEIPQTYELYFKKNDKVIHIRNNYDMELYKKNSFGGYDKIEKTGITNGETGTIEDIQIIPGKKKGEETKKVIVKYDGYYCIYEDDFSELELAWALTVHKSQGSAWKAVIVPMMTQYWKMLDNTIIYTAVTRARSFLCVIGQERAIEQAITTHNSIKRYTHLKERTVEYKQVA